MSQLVFVFTCLYACACASFFAENDGHDDDDDEPVESPTHPPFSLHRYRASFIRSVFPALLACIKQLNQSTHRNPWRQFIRIIKEPAGMYDTLYRVLFKTKFQVPSH